MTASTPAARSAAARATLASAVVGCSSFRLRRLSRLAARFYDGHLAAAGLKTTQYSLLKAIDGLGPITPGELARALTLDSSTLTRNLRPLLDAGWATLSAGPDGRRRQVAITAAGRQRRQEARRHWQQAQQAFNDCVGLERVAALHALLDHCQADLEAALAGAAPGASASPSESAPRSSRRSRPAPRSST